MLPLLSIYDLNEKVLQELRMLQQFCYLTKKYVILFFIKLYRMRCNFCNTNSNLDSIYTSTIKNRLLHLVKKKCISAFSSVTPVTLCYTCYRMETFINILVLSIYRIRLRRVRENFPNIFIYVFGYL